MSSNSGSPWSRSLAIIGFIALGVLAIFGFLPSSQVSGVSHLFDTQGFLPNGMGAVLGAILTTMFSFMGTEIVTIAAAESKNPGKQISKATNSVIWRIGLFYLVSIFIVVALVPWNDPILASVGSYQTVLERMGIPNAKMIVDIVVLVAVTSCLNSALYTSSRMLFSLGKRGDAPAMSTRTNASGTPYWAVMLSTGAAFLGGIRQLRGPGCGVRVPAGQLRRHRAAGVPGDRVLAIAHAQAAHGAR